MALVDKLRRKHPKFFYQRYKTIITKKKIKFIFDFAVEPNISFSPRVVIKIPPQRKISHLNLRVINNLAFHLGLMEIPSYWKATCSPEIIIQVASLDNYQIYWWKDLFIKGLGEFFYQNGIDFTVPDFLNFKAEANTSSELELHRRKLNPNIFLVSVGGGKDSAVTSQLLKKTGKKMICWSLNPTPAALEIIKINQTEESLIVTRSIDQRLLSLNKEGYLNGHTPFSAYLAFLGAVCAILFDCKNVVVSNERSANEGNVKFKGREINHQYSKSFDFEEKFRRYSEKYLSKEINYFSFLRPLYELQIVRIFSRFPQYFSFFRSCNKGQKTNSCCQNCPKCLFVFTALYPFLEERILKKIFSENLLEKTGLLETAFKLVGLKGVKPFECVGSKEEVIIAFYLCLKKVRQKGGNIPFILRALEERGLFQNQNLEKRVNFLFSSWDEKHALSKELETLLRREIRL